MSLGIVKGLREHGHGISNLEFYLYHDQNLFLYLGQVFDDPPRFGGDSGGEGGLLGVAGGRRRLERHAEPRAIVPSARFMNMYDPKYDLNIRYINKPFPNRKMSKRQACVMKSSLKTLCICE